MDFHQYVRFCSFPSLFSRENGAFEEALEPPSHSRLKEDEQQQEGEEDQRVDVMVFKENGFPKPLSAGVDDRTAQQGAGNSMFVQCSFGSGKPSMQSL